MKIEGSLKPAGATSVGETRARPRANDAQPSAPGAQVELSSVSSSLVKAEAAMDATPVVDRARVDEVREAIREGRFKVDAERIAGSLLDSVREMIGADVPRS